MKKIFLALSTLLLMLVSMAMVMAAESATGADISDVVIRDDITADELIDCIEGNKHYIPGIIILNKTGANVTYVETRGEIADTTVGTVDVEAGNVTVANLESNQSTYRWAALIGNASGNIVLGDDSSNVLHVWSANAIAVYASTAGSIDWSTNMVAAEAGDFGAYLNTADSDNFTSTFTGSAGQFSASNIATVSNPVDVAVASTLSADATGWTTYALMNGANPVFAVEVGEATDSYAGDDVDYQLLVPEDGTLGNAAITSYNVWLELQ